jgi:hypothetical protein
MSCCICFEETQCQHPQTQPPTACELHAGGYVIRCPNCVNERIHLKCVQDWMRVQMQNGTQRQDVMICPTCRFK